ncbi:MAG: hypothetical protein WB445_01240 [Acinetobacter sp.]
MAESYRFEMIFWSSFCSFVSPKEPKAFVIRETCSLSALKQLSSQKQSISKTTATPCTANKAVLFFCSGCG